MVREHDNMNLPRSQSVKRPEVYRLNIINYTVQQMLTIRHDSTTSSTPYRRHLRNIFLVSCKLSSGMRFRVVRDGFSDRRYPNTTQLRIDFRFDDSQRFGCMGQPSISRDSFCPKISVWSRLTFYALAVLSSLTFFRVGGNTECIQRHSTATSQINL